MQQLITNLKQLLASPQAQKDRYIKGHAKDLLTRLQALNPQDEVCPSCEKELLKEEWNKENEMCDKCFDTYLTSEDN